MSRARRAIRRFMNGRPGTAGAALVEFAITAPVMIVVFTGLADAGIMVYRQIEVRNAVQAGIQYAIDNSANFSSSSASSAVTNATTWSAVNASPAPSQFCGCPSSTGVQQLASCSSTCANTIGTYVTISAQATYTSLFAASQTLTSSATVRIQ